VSNSPWADLRIVAAESVRPHEIADPARERRIEARLQTDGMLRDPLMVGSLPDLAGFVLLDGTNRRLALAALGIQWVLAQVIQYADERAVQLRTWGHAVNLPYDQILECAGAIPGTTLTRLSPLAASDALRTAGTVAVLLGATEMFALSRSPGQEPSRAEQLRQLVDSYQDRMTRVDCDADTVEERAAALTDGPNPRALVAFPPFSRSQVVTMALRESLIPAGITRHVILGGRALRVSLPLDILIEASTREAADAALQQHLQSLQPRFYRESTILYDS